MIDNSSAWRMDPDVPLVVPEVNPHAIARMRRKGIVANPNCTTMAAMPVLKPLHDEAGLSGWSSAPTRRCPAAAWPASTSSTSRSEGGVDRRQPPHPRRLGGRLPGAAKFAAPDRVQRLPLAGSIVDDGLTRPTRSRSCATRAARSSSCPSCWCRGTCVRVPVFTGHSLSINAEFARPLSAGAGAGAAAPRAGRRARRRPDAARAAGSDPTLRRAASVDRRFPDGRGLALFVSNDNLRKGAALNAVQIAELVAARVLTA